MKAVGAVAAGRNRKVHMKTVSVTIYYDEGSKGSNPTLPQKSYHMVAFLTSNKVSFLSIPYFQYLYKLTRSFKNIAKFVFNMNDREFIPFDEILDATFGEPGSQQRECFNFEIEQWLRKEENLSIEQNTQQMMNNVS